jgi:two-component sensor histidine kinase/CheY-like chemotaxis protein
MPQDSGLPSLSKLRKAIHPDDFSAFQMMMGELSPQRNTGHVEVRIIRPNGETRWCAMGAVATFDENGTVCRFSGVTTDTTERKEAENRQSLLAREVDHRAKNALAVVQAIVRLARRDNIADYVKAVEGRVAALAQTHELLSQARWEGADVLRLILEELAPYHSETHPRITAIGPAVTVSPETAQSIALAIHELATNAAKYGSLSHAAGRVDISWSSFESNLCITWSESGGPAVTPPKTEGFGTKVLTSMNGASRGGANFDWRPEGLRLTLQIPCKPDASVVGSVAMAAPRAASEEPLLKPVVASGSPRILLVEDEALVGIFMHELLCDIGFETTHLAHSLEDAMNFAHREQYDCAILDVNLHGEVVYPLADLLRLRNVPFLFLTGYSPNGLEARFAHVPILQKPVSQSELERALASLLPSSAVPSRGTADVGDSLQG